MWIADTYDELDAGARLASSSTGPGKGPREDVVDVMETLARLLVSSAILAVPFGLLALASGRAEGLVWLMIPLIALVPMFLVAASLVFIPVEKMARHWGWPTVPALMVAGGVLGTMAAVLAATLGKKRSVILTDIASGDAAVIGSLLGLVALGAAMGAVWHLSRRVMEHLGSA